MKRVINRSKVLPAALSLVMLLSAALVPAGGFRSYAATFSDISGHWAKSYINQAVSYGFVSGYTDGTFKPDNPITRAEFTKMLNAAIGNTATTDIDFPDVEADDWYYSDVQKGVAAGFIAGDTKGNFSPEAYITRQEAAVMLSRVVPTYGSEATLKVYSDYEDVEYWAETALEKITAKGYLGAYNDGYLHPKDSLTRGQAAKILTMVLQNETIDKNNKRVVVHEGSDIVLENTIYANNMTIDAGITDDIVTFSNCVILGSLNVNGGKSGAGQGVSLLNTRVANAVIETGNSEVRVTAKGESTIVSTSVTDKAIIENTDLKTDRDFGKGFCDISVGRAADVELSGDFNSVTIPEEKVDLALTSGKITSLDITAEASKTTIDLASSASVDTVDVSALGVSFTGNGSVATLNAHANGITYEKEPGTINTDSSVTEPPAYASGGSASTSSLVITPTPANGATKVSTSDDIVLTFSSAVHLTDTNRSSLTDSQAETIILLREDSLSGSLVDFSADVASDGKSVTITPTGGLSLNVKYYLRIAAGELTDANGNENELFTSSFTTGTSVSDITFSPASGSTGVALTTSPTITFNYAVQRYSGSSVTSRYLKNSAITFEKKGPDDTKKQDVEFTAEIDSSYKQITITPDEELEEETTYYITINEDTLASKSDGEAVEKQTVSFTTTSGSLANRIASSQDSDEASISFKALSSGTVYGIILEQDDVKSSAPTAKQIKNYSYINSVSRSGHHASMSVSKNETAGLDFSNLDNNTSYYIYIVLYDSSGTAGAVYRAEVTTEK